MVAHLAEAQTQTYADAFLVTRWLFIATAMVPLMRKSPAPAVRRRPLAHMEKQLERRNATAAVIGAGDFIGSAIARKFAGEGFSIFAGRRNGDKLAPLVKDIEAQGGHIFARSLDARKEDDITAFLQAADREAPLDV
jgi:predicted amino acid dehydrogenase